MLNNFLKSLPILFLFSFGVGAQNIEQIGTTKPLKLSGGLGLNQVFHHSNQQGYRDPYNYYLVGNLNLDLYGLNLPFSFSFSNQQSTFRQPFNQFSISPNYKWARAQIGYTSMSFSPYTVSGHIFEGLGVELSPGEKWNVSLLYGRFQKPTLPDSATSYEGTYKRMGYGLNARYGQKSDYIGVSLFYALDDQNGGQELAVNGLTPEENLVAGLNFSKAIIQALVVEGEYALSLLTRDTNANLSDSINTLGLYNWRNSTEAYSAYNISINYRQQAFDLGLRYERVGAGYETHGAYYFNNDFQNLTVQTSFKLLRKKGSVRLNGGLQSSNVDNVKMSNTNRLVGSLNFSYSPIRSLSIMASYSNFTTYSNIDRRYLDQNFLTPFDQLDTLNYRQVSQQATVSGNFNLPGSQGTRSLLMSINFMESHDAQGGSELPDNSEFYSGQAGYRQKHTHLDLEVNTLLNVQVNNTNVSRMRVIGPLASISKLWLEKKFRTSFSMAYNLVMNSSSSNQEVPGGNGQTFNIRALGSYQLENHSFQLSLINVNRWGMITSSNELTANLGYNYRF